MFYWVGELAIYKVINKFFTGLANWPFTKLQINLVEINIVLMYFTKFYFDANELKSQLKDNHDWRDVDVFTVTANWSFAIL